MKMSCLSHPLLAIYKDNVYVIRLSFSFSSPRCKLYQSARQQLLASSPLRCGFKAEAMPNEFSSSFGGLGSILRKDSPTGLLLTPAQRKSSKPQSAVETETADQDLMLGLNEISNEVLKVILFGDERAVDALNEKVEYLERYLVQEGEMEAAKFLSVIRGMLKHKVPAKNSELIGVYKKAFERIWNIVEDSGWRLKLGSEKTAQDMVDDDILPPVLQRQN